MQTFTEVLDSLRAVGGDRIAVICGDQRITYAGLANRCERLATVLHSTGLRRGDRVAILAGNRREYLETYLGAPAAGFVIVPLNTRHAWPELEYALRDSGARVLLTDRDAAPLGDRVERIVRLGDEFESLLAAASLPRDKPARIAADDLAGLFYTGGTTGGSKGVMLSHGNLLANARHTQATVPQSEQDVYLIIAPLFHAAVERRARELHCAQHAGPAARLRRRACARPDRRACRHPDAGGADDARGSRRRTAPRTTGNQQHAHYRTRWVADRDRSDPTRRESLSRRGTR
jgi:non-ribosomal peptide synthetase component F